MPLGRVNDDEFESELNNSHVERRNGTKIDFDEVIDLDEESQKPRTSDNESDESLGPILTTAQIIEMERVGRKNDVPNVPDSLRKILAEDVVTNGLKSAKQLAQSLGGLSQPTLSTYARGEISPNHTSDKSLELLEYLNGRKSKVSKRALSKLNMAISHMTEDKIKECDAIELANVASKMAVVVKQMEPTVKHDDENKHEPVTFHIYAPSLKSENHYDVVKAKDNY